VLPRVVLRQVLGLDLGLLGVVHLEAVAVGVDRGLVPLQGAGGDEQVGNAPVVEIVDDGLVGGGAQAAEHREDLVLLQEGVGGLHRLGGVEGVVLDLVVDTAAVDAAVLVDVVEDGARAGGYVAETGGGRSGQRLVGTDDHGVFGGAMSVGLGVWKPV